MTVQQATGKIRIDQKFMPIYLDSIRVDSVLNFDLYIHVQRELVLYRAANLPFTEKTRQKLLTNKVDRLFVAAENKKDYQLYIEQNLNKILVDSSLPEEKKASILYETSTGLIKDVFSNPTFGENILRSQDMVANTVGFILKGREAFINLLKISSFDYHTYTHSVNVCTFSIALAQQLGIKDPAILNELGVGALLHDVGKSRISERIINKQSALTQLEFEIMKKHPKWGVEILTETNQIPQASYYPVLQHHERGDRRGHPSGLSLEEMHLYSRIVAIVDSFDAMTTERVYQHAMETFPALKIMLSLKGAFDDMALAAFVELMGPSGLTGTSD
ncbi:MAG: HD domain-containing protein [candidate division Zixibacteria bacterium]|nr:HD domain-containing protein [candidate division Zixibacteria bacterium]